MNYNESDLKKIQSTMSYIDKAMSGLYEIKESGILDGNEDLMEMAEMLGNINAKISNMTSKDISDNFLLESFDIQDEEDEIDLLLEEI